MKSTLPLCAVGLAWMATPAALSAQTSLYESFDYSSFNSFDSGSFAGTVTTDAGLTVRCQLDPNTYPAGVKVTDAELHAVNLKPHDFHGDWNYTVNPNTALPT